MPAEKIDSICDSAFSIDENIRSIIDAVTDGVVIIDTNHRIRFANERALKMLGYTPDEVAGCRCRKILQTSLCESSCPLTEGLNSGTDSENLSMCYTGKDRKILHAKSAFRLLRDERGVIIGGAEVFSDVTHLDELRADLQNRYSFANLIGKSPGMQNLYRCISKAAQSNTPVFISGEEGTGKELTARTIHQYSPQNSLPFIAINCLNKTEEMLEEEIFPAYNDNQFSQEADNSSSPGIPCRGTIFLSNIEGIPQRLLGKILIFLEQRRQVSDDLDGANKSVRFILSSPWLPELLIKKKRFPRAVVSMLNLIMIAIPSLRQRKEDIPLLAAYFCERKNKGKENGGGRKLTLQALELLMQYDFPGNVEELESILERSCICTRNDVIEAGNLPKDLIEKIDRNAESAVKEEKPLKTIEKEMIRLALVKNRGHLQKTAEQLGISRVTLWRRLKKHNLHTNSE